MVTVYLLNLTPHFVALKKPASGYLKISHFCQSQHCSQSLGLAWSTMTKTSKTLFTENEKVLCFHGPLIYEAKVCQIQSTMQCFGHPRAPDLADTKVGKSNRYYKATTLQPKDFSTLYITKDGNRRKSWHLLARTQYPSKLLTTKVVQVGWMGTGISCIKMDGCQPGEAKNTARPSFEEESRQNCNVFGAINGAKI